MAVPISLQCNLALFNSTLINEHPNQTLETSEALERCIVTLSMNLTNALER
jgi:hypothetical protein